MNICCDEDLEAKEIEVEISDDRDGWMNLGNIFCNPNGQTEVPSEMRQDDIYPRNLRSLIIKEVYDLKSIKIHIDTTKEKLIFEGSKKGLSSIGESIYNYFRDNAYDGLHFHLESFPSDNNDYWSLDPTNCCLTFVYRDRIHN